MKKVMVFGTFDIIHPGHVHMLKQAKEYGDFLVVIIARDNTVCEIKGKQPRNNEESRQKNLIGLGLADKIRLGCLDNKHQVIKEEKPDIIALGYDQKFFLDELENTIDDYVKIVRLSPFKPEIYKSSKLTTPQV